VTAKRRGALWLALLLILLLAFGLRLYDLEGQSFWTDEGLSLYRARQSLAGVLANEIVVDGVVTHDTNPALYFLLLNGWRRLAGETVFALRFLGVVLALPAVATIYFLGRTAFGRAAGLAAALLLALSPFHVWQTQVLRNYGFLLTLNLLSVSALWRFLSLSPATGHKRWPWLALWAGAGLAGIYTHYFGFFLFAFGLLALAVAAARSRRWPRLLQQRWFWVALLLATLLVIPAVPVAISRFLAGRQIDFYPVPVRNVIVHALSAFAVGMSRSLSHPWWRFLPAALLALVGLVLAWRRKPATALFLLGYQIVPLGLLLLLSLFNPLYNGTRHLLIGLPPFLIFLAAGITFPYWRSYRGAAWAPAGRRIMLSVGALFLVSQVAWLWAQFHAPELRRDDVQGAAEYLTEVARPEDLVILHDTLIRFTFDYYYEGEAPVITLPPYGRQDEDEMRSALAAAGRERDRIWFLTEPAPRTGFPRELLSRWAEANWPRFLDKPFPRMWLPVRLEGFTPRPKREALPAGVTPLDASFGEVVHLHGVTMPAGQRAGDPSIPVFYFSRLRPEERPYIIVLRLVDEQGTEWALVDGALWEDYLPVFWPEDTLLRYDHPVELPAGVPPGTYQIWMRIVDETGRLLPLPGGQTELRLPDLTVAAAACDADRATWPDHEARQVWFGRALTLLGTSTPAAEARPGHTLSLDLYWCIRAQPQQDYRLRLQLLDANGAVTTESLSPLGRAETPATALPAGRLVASRAQIVVPATATPGRHRLQLSVVPPAGGAPLPVDWLLRGRALSVGAVTVTPWPLETEFPPIATPFRADFGEPALIELHGYELESHELVPGEDVPLTLFWRAADLVPANYHVFLHVAGAGEEIVAQANGSPVNGFRPTTSWRAGEVIVDERTISLPASAPAGDYRLWLGFFDPVSNRRLPIFVQSEQQADDRLLLTTVEIGQ